MASVLDDLVPPPPAAPEPQEGAASPAGGVPPTAPELQDGGGPPAGGEPPAPPAPPRLRLWERPRFRQALWVLAVIVALLLIGVIFPPNFWRF